MSYTNINFQSKKALKDAIKEGKKVTVYNPGLGGNIEPNAACVFLEGPHYPAPHKWYAQAKLENGYIVSVK